MSVLENSADYFAAIRERRRTSDLIREHNADFEGYALELFERGLKRRIDLLTDRIKEYETRIGFTTLAPTNFWLNRVMIDSLAVSAGSPIQESAVNGSLSVRAGATENIYSVPRPLGTCAQSSLFPEAYPQDEPSSVTWGSGRPVITGAAA